WRRKTLVNDPNNLKLRHRIFHELRALGDHHLLHGRAVEARQWYGECLQFGQEVPDIGLLPGELDRLERRISLTARASEPGFDAVVALLELSRTWPFQLRLQREFDLRKDAARLAQTSELLAGHEDRFEVKYAAARGFARAAALTAPGDERRKYEQRCDELLARVLKFGGEVTERVRQDPAFAGRLPLDQTKSIGLEKP